MFQNITKLNLSEINTSSKFTLVDNTAIKKGRKALLVQSKYESEDIPKLNNMTTLSLSDVFSHNGLLTQTATELFEKNGIAFNKEGLSSATTALTKEGETFNYSSTLTASIGGIQAIICIHPKVERPNSKGEKVDLNILAWYLIFKTLRFDVNISSKDKGLLESAKTFSLY